MTVKKTNEFTVKTKCFFLSTMVLVCMLGCKLPTEKSSKEAILNIQNEYYDYWIEDTQEDVRVLRSKIKKITSGNMEQGYYYDEMHQLQYKNGEIITLTDADMTEYDYLASEYLDKINYILDNQEYIAYSDSRNKYKSDYYYFAISKEGLQQFGDKYSNGRITAYYRNGEFLYVDVNLFYDGIERPILRLVFGEINYVPVMPK